MTYRFAIRAACSILISLTGAVHLIFSGHLNVPTVILDAMLIVIGILLIGIFYTDDKLLESHKELLYQQTKRAAVAEDMLRAFDERGYHRLHREMNDDENWQS